MDIKKIFRACKSIIENHESEKRQTNEDGRSKSLKQDIDFVIHPILYTIIQFLLGNTINEVGKGSVFGEIALTADVGRTASVITILRCKFLTLNKQNYK